MRDSWQWTYRTNLLRSLAECRGYMFFLPMLTVLRSGKPVPRAKQDETPTTTTWMKRHPAHSPSQSSRTEQNSNHIFQTLATRKLTGWKKVTSGTGSKTTSRELSFCCPKVKAGMRLVCLKHWFSTGSSPNMRVKMHNPALNLAPFGRWTLHDKAAQAAHVKR